MKKNTVTKLACWILAVSMPSLWRSIYAQSLDEVLGAGKTEYKQAKPETMEKWENILTMLEASRFEAALPELQKYRGIDAKDRRKTDCDQCSAEIHQSGQSHLRYFLKSQSNSVTSLSIRPLLVLHL